MYPDTDESRAVFASDPDGWELCWQLRFEHAFPNSLETAPSLLAGLLDNNFIKNMPIEEGSIQAHTNMHRKLCARQRNLVEVYKELCAIDDFNGKWLESSADERKGHYMKSMDALLAMTDEFTRM